MKRPLDILNVRQTVDLDVTLKLCDRLKSRRLKRHQKQARADPEILNWWAGAHAMWRMKQGVPDEPPADPYDLDHLFDVMNDREPKIEHHRKFPKVLSREEQHKIEAWVNARASARKGPGMNLPAKMSESEKKEVRQAAAEMQAVYLDEHEIDVAFSEIHDRFPWLATLNERAWRQARMRARSGLPAGVGPLLLSGPPGIGKSSWSGAVANALGLPSVDIDVGSTGGVFCLQGALLHKSREGFIS